MVMDGGWSLTLVVGVFIPVPTKRTVLPILNSGMPVNVEDCGAPGTDIEFEVVTTMRYHTEQKKGLQNSHRPIFLLHSIPPDAPRVALGFLACLLLAETEHVGASDAPSARVRVLGRDRLATGSGPPRTTTRRRRLCSSKLPNSTATASVALEAHQHPPDGQTAVLSSKDMGWPPAHVRRRRGGGRWHRPEATATQEAQGRGGRAGRHDSGWGYSGVHRNGRLRRDNRTTKRVHPAAGPTRTTPKTPGRRHIARTGHPRLGGRPIPVVVGLCGGTVVVVV